MLTSSASLPATIGPYHIEGLLGQGGMGSVYRAVDPTLQRPVAIKLLSLAAAAVPGYADRFLQEARILAQLRHPNIVQVYGLGTHEGTPYMVQELLPGPTLEQQLQEKDAQGRRFAPDEVGAIVSQLAAALDAAHALGVIHRDVKPGNAIWNAAGQLVLTDFGIAKQTLSDMNQTQAGIVIGTPAYLSPEQAQGLALSPASDVYALGVVLYELLAGVVPFRGNTPLRVALDHVQTPPPDLTGVRADLPPAVAAVVRQALAKEPQARFLSAGALAHALAQAWAEPITPFAGSIHTLPTQVWDATPAALPSAGRLPAPVTFSPPPVAPLPQPVTDATIAQGAVPAGSPAPSAQPQTPTSRHLLPIFGGALAVLFVLGALLALAGGQGRDTVSTPAESTAAPAVTTPANGANPMAATAPPAVAPPAEPAPTEALAVEPTLPAAPVDSQPPNPSNGNGNGNGGNGNGNGNGNGKDKKDK